MLFNISHKIRVSFLVVHACTTPVHLYVEENANHNYS